MSQEFKRLTKDIFQEALEIPGAMRGAFLETRCAGRPDIRAAVDELLKYHDESDGFLEQPAIEVAGMKMVSSATPLQPGAQIGRYVVQRWIGGGGMGMVYAARQASPDRDVAVKVLRPGLLTTSMLKRFRREAAALGRLQHPGIAQIFEAGVDTAPGGAVPFLAMELVEGLVLTEHVERYGLSDRDRLSLVADVCDAVHHAHQRGVIHRDLKPANVVVQAPETGERGHVKVLDFGIASVIEEDSRGLTARTADGQLLGTIAYMSPERIAGNPTGQDVRSDVYSLGVMLYELLCGQLPYDVKGKPPAEIARVIRDEVACPLSQRRPGLRGDVEAIVHAAIHRDPSRRYQSAADLANDIRRHLQGEAIHARHDSTWYVIGRQLMRHRTASAVTAVLLVSLVVFAVYANVKAREYRDLAHKETAAREQANALSRIAYVEKERADEKSRQYAEELMNSSIERGKLEGAAGNLILAEDVLWKAFLTRPDSRKAKWALWELYHAQRSRWSWQTGSGAVLSTAMGRDGRTLFAAMASNELAVCDFVRGEELARVGVDAKGLSHVARDGAGRVVAQCNAEAIVYEWSESARAGGLREVARVKVAGATGLVPLGLSEDGASGVWRAKEGIVLVDFTDGSQVGPRAIRAGLSAAAVHRGQRRVALGFVSGDLRYESWDGAHVAWERSLGGQVVALQVSREGDALAVGQQELMLHVFETRDGSTRFEKKLVRDAVRTLRFSPDGAWLWCVGGGALQLYDARSGAAECEYRASMVYTRAAAWSEDGMFVISGSDDGSARVWQTFAHPGMMFYNAGTSWGFALHLSEDQRWVYSVGGRHTARKHHRATGEVEVSVEFPSERCRKIIASLEDGRLLAACTGGALYVLNAETLAVERTIEGLPDTLEIFAITFSPDRSLLAVGGARRSLRLLDARTLERIADLEYEGGLKGSTSEVWFSPDGRKLYQEASGDQIAVWDVASRVYEGTLKAEGSVICSAIDMVGNRLAMGTSRGTMEIWDLNTRTRQREITAHADQIFSTAFNAAGDMIATGSKDGTIRLWDSQTGDLLTVIELRRGSVPYLHFAEQDRVLLAAFSNSAVMVLDFEHFERFIAGNLEYQINRLRGQLEPAVDVSAARAWARGVLARPSHTP